MSGPAALLILIAAWSLAASAEDHPAPEAHAASDAGPAQEAPEKAEAASREAPMDDGSGRCLVDEKTVNEMAAREKAVAEREQKLKAADTELKAREGAIADELARLEKLREEVAGARSGRAAELEERVTKIIETLEKMSPKAAAATISTIDEGLAVDAMTRVSTERLAKIMNVMEPATASRLTERMAGRKPSVKAP